MIIVEYFCYGLNGYHGIDTQFQSTQSQATGNSGLAFGKQNNYLAVLKL